MKNPLIIVLVGFTFLALSKFVAINNFTRFHHENLVYSTKHRAVVSNFLDASEVRLLRELFAIVDPYMERLQGHKKFYGYHSNFELLFRDLEIKKHSNRNNHTSSKYMTTRMYDLERNFMNAIHKATKFLESYFNVEVRLDTPSMIARRQPDLSQHMNWEFARYGREDALNMWAHCPHIDECDSIEHYPDYIECLNHNKTAIRDFTALLYLDEFEGGDFTFIDVPNMVIGKKHYDPARGLFVRRGELSAASLAELRATAPGDRTRETAPRVGGVTPQPRSPRSLPRVSTPDASVTRRTLDSVWSQTGVFTRVAVAPGQLVVFSSGMENPHGVGELFSTDTRYTINLWYSKVERIERVTG